MADPATPSPSDRAETRWVAKMWLDAVRDDEPIKFDIRAVYGDINGFITAVCQEVEALGEELAEVRAARDEACGIAAVYITEYQHTKPGRRDQDRLVKLMKVGQ